MQFPETPKRRTKQTNVGEIENPFLLMVSDLVDKIPRGSGPPKDRRGETEIRQSNPVGSIENVIEAVRLIGRGPRDPQVVYKDLKGEGAPGSSPIGKAWNADKKFLSSLVEGLRLK